MCSSYPSPHVPFTLRCCLARGVGGYGAELSDQRETRRLDGCCWSMCVGHDWVNMSLMEKILATIYSFICCLFVLFSHSDIHCGFGQKIRWSKIDLVAVCSILGIVLRTKHSNREHGGVVTVNKNTRNNCSRVSECLCVCFPVFVAYIFSITH